MIGDRVIVTLFGTIEAERGGLIRVAVESNAVEATALIVDAEDVHAYADEPETLLGTDGPAIPHPGSQGLSVTAQGKSGDELLAETRARLGTVTPIRSAAPPPRGRSWGLVPRSRGGRVQWAKLVDLAVDDTELAFLVPMPSLAQARNVRYTSLAPHKSRPIVIDVLRAGEGGPAVVVYAL